MSRRNCWVLGASSAAGLIVQGIWLGLPWLIGRGR